MTCMPDILGEIIEPLEDLSSSPAPAALVEDFRAAMRRLAGGVGVITVSGAHGLNGITATSLTSLSLSPPSILASVRRQSRLIADMRRAGAFTVHLLNEDQAHQADVFAGRTEAHDRTGEVAWQWHEEGKPRIDKAIVHIDCALVRSIPIYTHVLTIGRVVQVSLGERKPPFVHYDGAYHRLLRS